MEFFLVMISVPLFLLILLGFALFVLPHYPRREPAHSAPSAAGAPGGPTSLQAGKTPGADTGPSNIVGWVLTLLAYAAFVVAMISVSKLNKEK
jgi:hypothetical protein